MKLSMMNVVLNRLIALYFALSCFFPAQVALALNDCGTHEIVSCEEHENQHFVARHAEDDKVKTGVKRGVSALISGAANEEHDSAHQIEKSKQGSATISKASTGLENFAPLIIRVLLHSFESSFVSTTLWPNAPPDPKNTFLSFLPSVRLQV